MPDDESRDNDRLCRDLRAQYATRKPDVRRDRRPDGQPGERDVATAHVTRVRQVEGIALPGLQARDYTELRQGAYRFERYPFQRSAW